MERKLYALCRRFRIACITISHRPALREFHDLQLTILGDDACGYRLDRLPATAYNHGAQLTADGDAAASSSGGSSSSSAVVLRSVEDEHCPRPSQSHQSHQSLASPRSPLPPVSPFTATDRAAKLCHEEAQKIGSSTPLGLSLQHMWVMFRLGLSKETSFGGGRIMRQPDLNGMLTLAALAGGILTQAAILLMGTTSFAKMMRAVFSQDIASFRRLLLVGA
jgi:hypothetical protein